MLSVFFISCLLRLYYENGCVSPTTDIKYRRMLSNCEQIWQNITNFGRVARWSKEIVKEDGKGITALGYAIGANRIAVVKLLLDNRANPFAVDSQGLSQTRKVLELTAIQRRQNKQTSKIDYFVDMLVLA
eukprot:5795688-Amphidinium_carterae.1